MVFPLDRHFGLYEDFGLCVIPFWNHVCVNIYIIYTHLCPRFWYFVCVHAHSVRKRLLVTFPQCLLKWNVTKLLGQLLGAGLLVLKELHMCHDNLTQCFVSNRFGVSKKTYCICQLTNCGKNIYQYHKETHMHRDISSFTLFFSCILNALIMDPLSDQMSRLLTPRGVC